MEKKKMVDVKYTPQQNQLVDGKTIDRIIFRTFCEFFGEFKKFTRMSLEDFEYLLHKISPMITKQDTRLRKAIPARVRLAVTLRFLSSGHSYESLHLSFKISPQIISQIIPEVCLALNQVLKEEIKIPSTTEELILNMDSLVNILVLLEP